MLMSFYKIKPRKCYAIQVRDFINMQIFLNQYIMYYLNHT